MISSRRRQRNKQLGVLIFEVEDRQFAAKNKIRTFLFFNRGAKLRGKRWVGLLINEHSKITALCLLLRVSQVIAVRLQEKTSRLRPLASFHHVFTRNVFPSLERGGATGMANNTCIFAESVTSFHVISFSFSHEFLVMVVWRTGNSGGVQGAPLRDWMISGTGCKCGRQKKQTHRINLLCWSLTARLGLTVNAVRCTGQTVWHEPHRETAILSDINAQGRYFLVASNSTMEFCNSFLCNLRKSLSELRANQICTIHCSYWVFRNLFFVCCFFLNQAHFWK